MSNIIKGDLGTAVQIFKADPSIVALVLNSEQIQVLKNLDEKVTIKGKRYDRDSPMVIAASRFLVQERKSQFERMAEESDVSKIDDGDWKQC